MNDRKVILILTTLLLSTPAFSAEFTADSRVVSGGRTMTSIFSYAGDAWRMDESYPEGKRVTIFREDKKSITVLWPDKKRYITRSLPEKEFNMMSTRKPGEEVERTALGQENVSGYPTTKYRVRYIIQGREMAGIEWFSKDLGVVIKSQGEDNSWSTELTNIKAGKLGRNLFEIPADYQQLLPKDFFKGPEQKNSAQ